MLAAQLTSTWRWRWPTLVVLLAVARIAYGVAAAPAGGRIRARPVLAAAALLGDRPVHRRGGAERARGQAAGAILFFPMMFFAGLWLPIAAMPAVLQHISHVTPLGAAVQALQDAVQGHLPHPLQLITLAAYALVFGLVAARLFRWE